jgi:hypothetical protein
MWKIAKFEVPILTFLIILSTAIKWTILREKISKDLIQFKMIYIPEQMSKVKNMDNIIPFSLTTMF